MVLRLGICASALPGPELQGYLLGPPSKHHQMGRQKIVGYMCLGFGCLFLLELAFRLIR